VLSSPTPHNPARRINPHVHCIIPGGGVSPDGKRWISCRPGFFLPVRVLSRLFRRLFLEGLVELFEAGRLCFFNDLAGLADRTVFLAQLAPLRKREWVVYAKRPFAGPEQVLAYLARYTHRVAISNSRLVEMTDEHVAFRWKDYRQKGLSRSKTMTLPAVSSFAGFCFTSYPTDFAASATTGSSPTGIAPANWLYAANSSARRAVEVNTQHPHRMPIRWPRPAIRHPVPAAAAA